jgi:hypothetical protein
LLFGSGRVPTFLLVSKKEFRNISRFDGSSER